MNLQMIMHRIPYLLVLALLVFTVGFSVSCSSAEAEAGDETEASETEGEEEELEEEKSEETDSFEEEANESEETVEDSEKEKPEAKSGKEDADANEQDSGQDSKKEPKGASKKNNHGDTKADSGISVTKLWADLLAGNKRFVAGQHSSGQFVASRKSLLKGQNPDVIVISCSDSRVPPELVFDKNLGEIFVIRTAGNVADPIALGSIEYAAEHLHSRMLVVLGHETCGAVGAVLSGDKMPTKNLNAIVNAIRPAFKGVEECKTGGEGGTKCIKLNVTNSAREMVAKSPILKHLVGDGSLHIVKAIYEMESGKVVRF